VINAIYGVQIADIVWYCSLHLLTLLHCRN